MIYLRVHTPTTDQPRTAERRFSDVTPGRLETRDSRLEVSGGVPPPNVDFIVRLLVCRCLCLCLRIGLRIGPPPLPLRRHSLCLCLCHSLCLCWSPALIRTDPNATSEEKQFKQESGSRSRRCKIPAWTPPPRSTSPRHCHRSSEPISSPLVPRSFHLLLCASAFHHLSPLRAK